MFRYWLAIPLLAVGLASAIAAPLGDKFPRERGKKTDAAKNAMEGKAPPKLDVSKWMNTEGKPLSLDKLRGKVVVLDFWGTW